MTIRGDLAGRTALRGSFLSTPKPGVTCERGPGLAPKLFRMIHHHRKKGQ